MSGYRFELLVEFESYINKVSIQDVVKAIDVFIVRYINENRGIEIVSSRHNFETNNVELIFYDSEHPFSSFILFFEKYGDFLKYICLIDNVNSATDLISRDDFFDKFIFDLNKDYKIKQALFMCDPYYKSFEDAFDNFNKNLNLDDLDVRKKYQTSANPNSPTGASMQ